MKKKIAYEEVIANLCRVGIDYHSSADYEIEILRGTFEKCDDGILTILLDTESTLFPVLMDLTELFDCHVCHTR